MGYMMGNGIFVYNGREFPDPVRYGDVSVGSQESDRIARTNPESTEGGRRVSVLKRQEGAPVLLG